MPSIKVLAISPYPGMVPLLTETAKEYDGLELTISVGDLAKGLELAQKGFHANFDVIISRGGTARLLKQSVSLPVIEIGTTVYDVLCTLQRANIHEGRVAIVGYSNITQDMGILRTLLPYQLDVFTIQSSSQAVTTLVNGFLGKFGLGPLSEHIIRKLAHFSEFMLEGFLLMLCLRVYTQHFVRHISWPLLAGMSTALMDETIQISIPNRTSSVTDVWIDMAGVIAGLFVALIILLILRATMAFYQVKRENKALRAEQEALRQREHERLARRAAHRAAQGEDNNEEEDEA